MGPLLVRHHLTEDGLELLRGDLTVVGEVEEREGFLQRVLRRHLRVRHRRREELVVADLPRA